MISLKFCVIKQDFYCSIGWEFKLEGVCCGGECILFFDGVVVGKDVVIDQIVEVLYFFVVYDVEWGFWVVGFSYCIGKVLSDIEVDFILLMFESSFFELLLLCGKKVLVYVWVFY